MTKLTVQEIKGLIETQGSNKIKIKVQVPQKVFQCDVEVQKRLISEIAVGSPNALVESYAVDAIQLEQTETIDLPYFKRNRKYLTMDVELVISDEVLEEIELFEFIYQKKTAKSVEYKKPLTLKELKELTDNGINSFVMEINRREFSMSQEEMMNRFGNLISEEIQLTNAQFELLTQNMYEALDYMVKITIPSLKEQVEQKLNYENKIKELYQNPFGSDLTFLKSPLSNIEVHAMYPIVKVVAVPFQFLIEVPYDYLRNNDEYYLNRFIKECILETSSVRIEDLREKPVGFNPETNSIILLTTGLFTTKG